MTPTSQGHKTGEVAACADEFAAAALRELPDALIVAFDANLRVVVTAGHALDRLGAPVQRLAGAPLQKAFPPALWSELEPLFRSALDGETRSREVSTADQQHFLIAHVGPLRRADGAAHGEGVDVAGGVAVVLDSSARASAELHAKRRAGGAFEEVFERAPIGTGLLDRDGRWLLANRALCEITGYTPDELIGRRFEEIVRPEDAQSETRQRVQLLAGEISALQLETSYVNAAGEQLAAIVSMSLVRADSGEPLHYIAQLQDISERKQLEERLRHLADHDPLTGLRNRRLFDADLELQVARSRRYGEVAGLIVLDLDAFKAVNDSHGHKAGDDTLKAVAHALRRRLRGTDLVARLGGDEFAALLPHVDADNLRAVADGLARVIRACPIEVGDVVLHTSASIGCALIDERSTSAEEVFARADRAMYAAKRAADAR